MKKKMKKFYQKFKEWHFERRKNRAIKQAQQLANEQRCKFLVMNISGKPVVTSMQRIRHLIRTKQLKHTADYYRRMALYEAMPQKRK